MYIHTKNVNLYLIYFELLQNSELFIVFIVNIP